MYTNDTRATLVSSGEHLYAVRKLGSNYSVEQYLELVEFARAVGAGEDYANSCLGPDVDALLKGVEAGDDEVVSAVEASLKRRGIDPASATFEEYRDAFVEAGA